MEREQWRSLCDITRKLKIYQPRALEEILGRQMDLYHFLRKSKLFPDGRVFYLPHVYVRGAHGLTVLYAYLALFYGNANFES